MDILLHYCRFILQCPIKKREKSFRPLAFFREIEYDINDKIRH